MCHVSALIYCLLLVFAVNCLLLANNGVERLITGHSRDARFASHSSISEALCKIQNAFCV